MSGVNNFPGYLQDRTKVCGNGHKTLHSTPEKARNAKCPKCAARQAKEAPPRSPDPEPWATGYGGQRARQSRQRGIERSKEVRGLA